MKQRYAICLWLMIVSMLLLSISPALVSAQAPEWDGESRFTVLVLGMDRRPGARDALSVRTDVVMLVSIDPASDSIGILSIPRDLYFAPAGSDLIPVNTLLVEGEKVQEGYGPYHAIETLQLNLGMYIDAYIAFDFEAFITIIDAIGGIDVDVPYSINDPEFPDMNYGYDPFFISRGEHHLDGRTALKYVRSRHADSDYERGERQIQVLEAIRTQLSDAGRLQRVLGQAPALMDQLQRNIYSDITPEQMLRIGLIMMNLPADNIHGGALNRDYTFDYASPNGTIRVPDREKLVALLIEVFGEYYWQG